ncbi:hypothetical protein JKF63_06946 [Porcisia hertigi]|uniref:Uncharacterized protein n=1 Tax=Porcisia hertigi TaxID=2761500 RepID=A0A836YIK3_9TRYP|nr:hypothetical protein JKF63_06946 [Porcisia hertigi]
MRLTCVSAGRAVRMYAPMQVASTGGPIPSAACPADDKAASSNEVCAARRITEVILRARANRKVLQQPQLSPPAPVPPLGEAEAQTPHSPASVTEEGVVKRTVSVQVQTAAQLALSFGKSAFMTHLVHQHHDACQRPGAFSASEWDHFMVDEAGEAEAAAMTASPNARAAVSPRVDTPQVPCAAAGVQGLQTEVNKVWNGFTDEARVRWITSTPQGRRALEHATKLSKLRSGMAHRDSDRKSAAHVSLHLEAMLSKYEDTLVQPRLPRAAALAPPPRESMLRINFQGETGTSADSLSNSATGSLTLHDIVHGAYANNANCRHLRDRADAVRREERKKLWQQALVQILGGEAAFMFLRDVKDLQQPREKGEEAPIHEAGMRGRGGTGSTDTVLPSTAAAIATRDATQETTTDSSAEVSFSDGLLDLCESLGIRSPRRAYVLSRVLPQVDAATASQGPAPSLAEVRDLAKRCTAEYDKLRCDAARTAREAGFASAQDAVRAFEREQLALAVAGVQAKLRLFEEKLPLLKNCVRVLSK